MQPWTIDESSQTTTTDTINTDKEFDGYKRLLDVEPGEKYGKYKKEKLDKCDKQVKLVYTKENKMWIQRLKNIIIQ